MNSDTETVDLKDTGMVGTYLFNDYFSNPDDQGVEIAIKKGGKIIPFRIKRVLNLGEKQNASNAAVKIAFDVKGVPSIGKVDQGAFTVEIVLAGLLWWPYEYENHQPVPINRKTITMHDQSLNEAIAERLLQVSEVQVEALAPFGKQSEDRS